MSHKERLGFELDRDIAERLRALSSRTGVPMTTYVTLALRLLLAATDRLGGAPQWADLEVELRSGREP